jgi:hypothetical protein
MMHLFAKFYVFHFQQEQTNFYYGIQYLYADKRADT